MKTTKATKATKAAKTPRPSNAKTVVTPPVAASAAATGRRRVGVLGSASGRDVIGVGVDDAGLVAGVAETVAELASLGRVNMTSCVVNGPAWHDASRVLRRLQAAEPNFQCGLHFNLTEGVPLSAELARVWPTLPRLERLLVEAHLRRLPLDAIGAEWRAQCKAFRDAMGAWPAFIDGHQHVHALPGVRERLLADLRAWPRLPAVRNTGHLTGPGHAFKRLVIEGTGGRALQRALMREAVPFNAAMTGVYGFETLDYGALVRRWLASAPREGALLMCHPLLPLSSQPPLSPLSSPSSMPSPQAGEGRNGNAGPATDPIAAARQVEAIYLASARFSADLAAAGFTVGAPWAVRTTSGG